MRDYAHATLVDTTTMIGLVKWFDGTKGFGFVAVEGIDGEFLLHRHVLNKINRNSIAEGSTIEFIGACSENGRRVASVSSVTAPPGNSLQLGGSDEIDANQPRFPARVKWFNPGKGYGFVNCYGSDEDVFVGTPVLMRSGLSELQTGEAVSVVIEEHEGQKRACRLYDWTS